MKMLDVQIALEGMREAREKWGKARAEFHSNYEMMFTRLVYEAARNYMTPRDIALSLGVSVGSVRKKMRDMGMDPTSSRRLLGQRAAEALMENSALLGIEPHDMDLTSPLAYLPMGKEMRRELLEQSVSQVTELPTEYSIGGLENPQGVYPLCTVPGCNCDVDYRASL